jgi:hypothetical protein
MEDVMKIIFPILLLAASVPALGETAPGKADKPVIYDRNSRQILPYDRRPLLCPRSDQAPAAACAGAEKPEPEKALRSKDLG